MLTQTQPVIKTIKTALNAGPQQQIERLLHQHLDKGFINDRQHIETLGQTFRSNQYVWLEGLMPLLFQTGARGEASELLNSSSNSMISPQTHGTPAPYKVSHTDIEQESIIISSIYYSHSLHQLLSLITADDVVPYCAKDRGLSITHLQAINSHQNWLYTDHSYHLLWFLKTPKLSQGGALEFTKKPTKQSALSFNGHSVQPLQRQYATVGNAVLLKTDTHHYRFAPLTQDAEYIIVSMSFGNDLKFIQR